MIGTTLDERYKILSVIAEGSMSIVYKAEHQLMKRTVAIKMLKSELAVNPKSVVRFQQEAKAVSSLVHENIVAVHDFGITPAGHPYLVMDLVEGENLASLLKRERNLPLPECLEIFCQACAALSHAHKHGIIHRDIKPTNIMLLPASDGCHLVKLVDFGIAKLVEGEDSASLKLTTTGDSFCSPLYMSPEQCMGRPLDARSDIYSLGCVMFEVLTGTQPFSGKTNAELVQMHIKEAPAWPEKCGQTPDKLKVIVLKAMTKNPAGRQETMTDLARDLDAIKGDLKTDQHRSQSADFKGKGPRSAKRHSAPLLIAVIVLVAGAICALVISQTDWQLGAAYLAFNLDELSKPLNSPEIMKSAFKLADEYERTGHYRQAADLLSRFLPTYKSLNGESSVATADLLFRIAWLYIHTGKEQESKNLSLKAERIILDFYEQYKGNVDLKKRLPLSQKLLKIRDLLYGPTSKEAGFAHFQLANDYARTNQPDKAESEFRQAISICKIHQPEAQDVLAWSLLDLGLVNRQLGKLSQAERYAKEGVDLLNKIFGPESSYALESTGHLANIYRLERKFVEAEKLMRYRLAAYRKFNDADSSTIAHSEFDLANVLSEKGDLTEAEGLVKHALRIFLQKNEPLNTCDATLLLSQIHAGQGKYSQCLEETERAAKICRDFGITDKNKWLTYFNIKIECLAKVGRQDEARRYARERQKLKQAGQ